jgi:hypothetical protein
VGGYRQGGFAEMAPLVDQVLNTQAAPAAVHRDRFTYRALIRPVRSPVRQCSTIGL